MRLEPRPRRHRPPSEGQAAVPGPVPGGPTRAEVSEAAWVSSGRDIRVASA